MIRTYKALVKRRNELNSFIGKMERKLTIYIMFDFAVVDVPGDGFCVLNAKTANLTTLGMCINLINDLGELTEKNIINTVFNHCTCF